MRLVAVLFDPKRGAEVVLAFTRIDGNTIAMYGSTTCCQVIQHEMYVHCTRVSAAPWHAKSSR